MISFIPLFFCECFLVPGFCYIKFAANYRFYFHFTMLIFVFMRFSNKLENAKHIPMVTDGKRGHSILYRLLVKTLNRRGPIEQGKLSMDVEVREFHTVI